MLIAVVFQQSPPSLPHFDFGNDSISLHGFFPEQVFDGEPRDADGLDEGELRVVDGLPVGVRRGRRAPVLHRLDGVQGHPHGGDHDKSD